jgi:4-hydroxybenzoate polyprenyltransferase
LAWAAVTVVLPVVESNGPIDTNVLFEFVQRAAFVIAITIPFDIRDLRWDRKELKTLPQVFGIRGVKYVGYALVLVFVVLEMLRYQEIGGLMATGFVTILTVFFMFRSAPERHRYFTSFWVESLPIVWFVLNTVFLIF